MSGLIDSKSVSTIESNIKGLGNSNVVSNGNVNDEANIVDIASMRSSVSRMSFLIFRTRLAFVKLRQTFNITPIFFDLEYYMRIKTDASSYTNSKILSQLTLDGLG